MAKKANAWQEYKGMYGIWACADHADAAVLDMLLQVMPKVVAEIAAPLAKAERVTMIAGGEGDIGAARLTGLTHVLHVHCACYLL